MTKYVQTDLCLRELQSCILKNESILVAQFSNLHCQLLEYIFNKWLMPHFMFAILCYVSTSEFTISFPLDVNDPLAARFSSCQCLQ